MLRVALIGAGIMGANHARVINGDRKSELVYVVDTNVERAALVARGAGAKPLASAEQVRGQVDAAVVAVPTDKHLEVALPLLEAGVPVLVEKPIAASVDEGEQLVAAARRAGSALAVGHVERFNPAVMELETIATAPVHVDFRRISSFSGRPQESVVRDLMIHDIDLARMLARAEVAHVSAVGRRDRGATDDLVIALLTFANGVTASLTASRIGQQKIREIDVTQKDNFVHVDLLREDVTIHHVHHVEFLSDGGPRYSQSGVVEIPYLSNRGEPLALEWAHFAQCVCAGERPRVSGEDGVRALAIAEQVEAEVDRSSACTKS